jgi:cystinosin
MCVIIYSQFFPQIWGFTVGRTQKVSKAVLGIFCGLVLGVLGTLFLALWVGKDRGNDASGWAWIDVVSSSMLPSRFT